MLCCLCCVSQFFEHCSGSDSQIVHLFSNSTAAEIGATEIGKAFDLAYGCFEKYLTPRCCIDCGRVLSRRAAVP